jgi:hypothetical protein
MAAPRWSERPGPPNARREDGQRNWRQRRSMRDRSRALCVESGRWKSRKMRSTKSAGAGSSGGGRRPAAKFSGPNNTPGRSLGKETRTRMDDISHDVCVNVKRARLVSGLSRTRCRRWLQRGRPGAADDEGRVGRLFVNDADRAGDVVDRIGSLKKKRHPGGRSSTSMRPSRR